MAFRAKATYISALLAIALAPAAFADTIVLTSGTDATDAGFNVNIAGTVAPPQVTFSLNGVNANGNFVATEYYTVSTGQQIYFYSGIGAAPVQTNPLATTTSPGTVAGPNTAMPVLPYAEYPNSTTTVTTYGTEKGLSSNGSVIGYSGRAFGSTASSWGNEGYLYIPANAATSTPSSLTIFADQGILAPVNTTGGYTGTLIANNQYLGTTFYSSAYTKSASVYNGSGFTTSSVTQLLRQAFPIAVNSQNQVIGTVNRYTGVDSNAVLGSGTDAFIYNPLNTAAPVAIIGLYGTANTVDNPKNGSGATLGNVYNYYTGNNSPVAINDMGSAVGTAARYQSQASAASSAGQDVWLYTSATPATTGSSTQIGLVGNVATTVNIINNGTPGTVSEYYAPVVGSYSQESSSVAGINSVGQVAGTSAVYQFNNAATPTLGQEAWLYTPIAGGGTATAYGTSAAGTYVQLGLTSVTGQSASGDTTKVIGYANSSGQHSSTVIAVSNAGYAVGTSARYYSNSTTALNNDAYFYTPVSGSTRINPTANAAFSNYTTSTGISNATSLFINNGVGTAAVAAGLQTRYNPSGDGNIGADAFAYVNNNTYVIASPALLAGISSFNSYHSDFTSSEYFLASVFGVTDGGEVYGYFTAYTDATTATKIGVYYYTWTLDGGTTLLTSTATTALVDALSATGLPFTSLNAGTQVYADAAGNVYGTFTGHAFELDAPASAPVPEPASLALLGAGGLLLLRRRSKR